MKTKQLCQNCGSEWETEEPNKNYLDHLGRWVIVQPDICLNCIKKLLDNDKAKIASLKQAP